MIGSGTELLGVSELSGKFAQMAVKNRLITFHVVLHHCATQHNCVLDPRT
jgi:hypothetical protein